MCHRNKLPLSKNGSCHDFKYFIWQYWYLITHTLKIFVKLSHKCSVSQCENFLLHFCRMKQNHFGNSSVLFLCVMPLFLELVCVFQATDESQLVNRRREARDPVQCGGVCTCKLSCNCVWILGKGRTYWERVFLSLEVQVIPCVMTHLRVTRPFHTRTVTLN